MITSAAALRPDLVQAPWQFDESAEALADLFGAEAADSVQTEAEHEAVLFAQADVEGRELRRQCAAIPTVSQRERRTNQRTVTTAGTLLKADAERTGRRLTPAAAEGRRKPARRF